MRDDDYKLILSALMLLVFGGYLFCLMRYAERFPYQAMLEGADLVQLRQIEMADKGHTPEIPTANVAPPIVIESKGGDSRG